MSDDPNRLIRRAFHVKPGDSLPFKGWSHRIARLDVLSIFAQLGYTKGAEIGVAQGTFSRQICDTVPGVHLLCVDPWQAYGRINQAICDERYARACAMVGRYDVEIIRKASLQAAQEVPDGSLDFVYIDGAHDFDNAMLDIILWAPKVRKGGIVSGHDYYEFYRAGVVSAVRAYTQAHGICQWYVTWEKEASWLWVRA